MLPSSSHPLTAASRTRAPNNVRNENSDPPSHKDDQTPLSNENEDEDEGFSEFIACLGAEDDAKTDQWQCSTCSFINKNPLHLTCDICGTVRKGRESEDRIIKEQIEKHLMPYDSKGMGIENCPDEEDAPIPAAQIAARYESMEETAKKPAIIDDGDSPHLGRLVVKAKILWQRNPMQHHQLLFLLVKLLQVTTHPLLLMKMLNKICQTVANHKWK